MSAYRWTIEWARANRVRAVGKMESPSTNLEAKELAESLGHRALVVADHQTAGRGRGDHTWTDGAGQALLSSWIFQAEKPPQPIMSALIGLSLFEAAHRTWPKISWALKAPNDLHVVSADRKTAKKIAGLLIELVSGPKISVVVGLGLNVTGAPEGTKPYPATCLGTELAERELTLTEADWGRFLKTWIDLCETRVAEGLTSELKQASADALAHALSHHPDFHDIESVEPNGSLVFKSGRRVDWQSL